jgi:hypothetical protein
MLLSSADRKSILLGGEIKPNSMSVVKIPTLVEFLTAENRLIYMEPLETLEQDWISITAKGVR